ncbi:MAG: tetratricopeptide repeat protein [bacterium]
MFGESIVCRSWIGIGLLFTLVLTPFGTMAREPENARDLILKGIEQLNRAYDQWDKEGFEEALRTFEQASETAPDDHLPRYWEGVALFHLAIHHLFGRDRDRDETQGEARVDAGITTLERAVELNDAFSESYALLGVLQGMKIKLHILSALSLGPRVKANRNRALELNPENPRVHYLTGVSLRTAPEIFGGGTEKALKHFDQAEALFERESKEDADPLQPRWGHSTCLAFMGDLYAERKDYQQAQRYYLKALQVNPNDSMAQKGLETIKPLMREGPHP